MATHRNVVALSPIGLVLLLFSLAAAPALPQSPNLLRNPDFQAHTPAGPTDYQLAGDARYQSLGDPAKDTTPSGVALQSARAHSAGAVSQTIHGINPAAGRWFRFTFRGLPQDHFAVREDNLYMKVEFFGGQTAYDGKDFKIYPLVQQARRDLSVNGDRHVHGAEVWRTYELDFWLPFPQIDTLRLSVGFADGAGTARTDCDFYVTDFNLVRLTDNTPPDPKSTTLTAPTTRPQGKLLPLGGRWFYLASEGETQPPARFDAANADRLLYHDGAYCAPFSGNMTAWLRAGEMDQAGHVVLQSRLVQDNVTVTFDATSLIVHTRGLPNHPTGKFPNNRFGDDARDPSYIQEQDHTYYIPLNPQENPRHLVVQPNNTNRALPGGPIGVAVNGVVFFNPFDANNMDASNIMDRCCGHPAPDGQYHYHKYPVCVNTPWADQGTAHSPLIGWAFDGYPVYGPYESAGVMAKDLKGARALNGFNMHYDEARGWHYHVTPGQFPYLLGGYWGTEDPRDHQRPGPMQGNGPGQGNGQGPRTGRQGPPGQGPRGQGPRGQGQGPGHRPPPPPF